MFSSPCQTTAFMKHPVSGRRLSCVNGALSGRSSAKRGGAPDYSGRVRVLWLKAPLALRHHAVVLAALVSIAALVAAVAAADPFVRAGVAAESLQTRVRSLTPLAAGLEVHTGGRAATEPARRAAAARLGGRLPTSGPPVATAALDVEVTDELGGFAAVLMARTGALAHVQHLASAGGRGVWISDETATALRARPGARLAFSVPARDGRRVLRLPVAGVYRALDADLDNPYWQNFVQQIRSVDPNAPSPPPFVLTDERTLLAAAGRDSELSDTFEFPVAVGGLTLARAHALERRYAAVRVELRDDRTLCPRSCSTTSSLSAALLIAGRDVAAVDPTVALVSWLGLGLGVLAALAAGVFLVRRRSGEVGLLHARGEASGAFAARTALESVLPVAAGCAAGVALAALALRTFAPAGTLEGGTLLAGIRRAVAADAAAVCAVAAGAALAFPRTRRLRTDSLVRTAARLPWEIVPLAVAAVAVGLLLAGGALAHGADGTTHPRLLVFVAPAVAAAGVAGLAARAGRFALRRASPGPAVLFLALRRLATARATLVAVVAAVAATSAAFAYAVTLEASLQRSVAVKAVVANGSDVQGVVDHRDRITTPFPFPAAIVADDWLDVKLPSGEPVDLIAGDPRALERTILWRDGWAGDPRPALRKLAAADTGDAVPALATADAADVPFVLDQGVRLPVRVVGRVATFPATTSGRPALVVPVAALHAAARRVHLDDPLLNATGYVWARGDPAVVEPALRRSSLAPAYLTAVDHLRQAPSVRAAGRTDRLLRVVGLAGAGLALVALLLYLQARQRAQVLASAVARRMGLAAGADAAALALEAAALVAVGAMVGMAVAVAVAHPLVPRVDPLPQYAPAPFLVVPWTILVAVAAAATASAAAVGAVAAAIASRADVGGALRVA
jgi:putative ABC transport system permease protein